MRCTLLVHCARYGTVSRSILRTALQSAKRRLLWSKHTCASIAKLPWLPNSPSSSFPRVKDVVSHSAASPSRPTSRDFRGPPVLLYTIYTLYNAYRYIIASPFLNYQTNPGTLAKVRHYPATSLSRTPAIPEANNTSCHEHTHSLPPLPPLIFSRQLSLPGNSEPQKSTCRFSSL